MLNKIRLKLYYRFLELISLSPINKEILGKTTKNCFIYYDYEREFSGHETNITNTDIEEILDHLDQIQLKTTWFTVGKVMEKYSDTILKITQRGHEIGSHTFAHISPKVMNRNNMETDFKNFENIRSKNKLQIEGFHSPNGQWNILMFDFLIKNNFTYDVISLPDNRKLIRPMRFNFLKNYPIVRLVTVGDDWPLFKAQKSSLEVFEYFKGLYDKTKKGDTFGIGFHPWILYSDKNILSGYKDFLSYVTQQNDVILNPANEFVDKLNASFRKIKNY